MENASKALLIAGAILIVILLIGVGMMVYNSAMGSIEGAISQMDTQEINQFNSQFTAFEGKQKGTAVRSLLSKVIANNATYSDSVKQVTVTTSIVNPGLTNSSDKTAISNLSASINTSKTYTVTFGYAENGLINSVTIK